MGVQKEYSRKGKLNEKKKFMHANELLKKFMLRQKKFIPGIIIFFFQMGCLEYN